MERSYKTALDLLLYSRPRKGRPNNIPSGNSYGVLVPDAKPSWKWTPTADGKPYWNGIGGMKENLELIGYSDNDLSRLNIIHVAGTKGKGGTCAFVYALLRAHGQRTGFPQKIGLYTSPHLLSHRERIQINQKPISEELFTKYFFEIWDVVANFAIKNEYRRLGFLQFFTLLSVHIFIKEGVDAAIYETHHGGEYDPTNVLLPTVTGITTLGMDHEDILGPKIENIAWHKGGILKAGAPAFSSPQTPAAAQVLQQRADEKGVELKFTDANHALLECARALEPEVQRINASLALELTNAFLRAKAYKGDHRLLTLQDIARGVEQYSWPGRFHHIAENSRHWFLDVAHNQLSVNIATQWFAKTSLTMQRNNSPPWLVLIFSHNSFRDGTAILHCIADALRESGIRMNQVIFPALGEGRENFTPSDMIPASKEDEWLDIQERYADAWKQIDPEAEASISPSVPCALDLAKRAGDRAGGMQAFMTGDIRLIGRALSILEQ